MSMFLVHFVTALFAIQFYVYSLRHYDSFSLNFKQIAVSARLQHAQQLAASESNLLELPKW